MAWEARDNAHAGDQLAGSFAQSRQLCLSFVSIGARSIASMISRRVAYFFGNPLAAH